MGLMIESKAADAWTVHGGRLDAARRAYPDVAEWIDLSTGINPDPWPIARAGVLDWGALPEPIALAELEAAAAGYFGVAPDRVVAVPGSETGLRLLGRIGLPAPYRHAAPGYRTHADIFPGSIGLSLEGALSPPPGGTIVFGNPDNPTGRIVPAETVFALADARRASGGWLIVDEAFADTDPDISVLPHLAPDASVIVLRSFGKFFGLAGVRLGFVVAPRAIDARVRRAIGAWPVSSAAIAFGTAAYRDDAWIAETRGALVRRAEALDQALRRHRLEPIGGCPLFRTVETPDAARLFGRLAACGILTRPFDHSPTWLRFGVPSGAEALARLDAALGDG
ncbi:threonine-phosphate decarboxylase [Sphingomonas bacterium]|uniref:threonine-phosphate decarboxylase n=1 Tax=Sphingomonas bacterium TaxID=1895847 RepID=UPI0020C68F2A|nr:threonine-phosphate decarboxylase [Sphingomonas bacterium]